VRKSPFDFGAWGYLGWPLVATGEPLHLRELHEIMARICEATPQHPGVPYWLYHRSVASSCEQLTDQAVEFAQLAIESNPTFPWGLFQLANAYGSAGKVENARNAVVRSLEINPALTADHYQVMICQMSSTSEIAELRQAGLYQAGILARRQ
jgi:tetratricopeptide (TPR) repeat protein